MASKYIDLSTVKFFMNNVQELESILKKERFVDHDLESVDLFIESIKHFADRELFPYFKEMDEKQLARASWERSLEIKPDNNESKGWLILSSQGS